MIPDIQILDHSDGPWKGKKKIVITCDQEDLDRFKNLFVETFRTMHGAVGVRNLMFGGLTQLFQAAKVMGGKK